MHIIVNQAAELSPYGSLAQSKLYSSPLLLLCTCMSDVPDEVLLIIGLLVVGGVGVHHRGGPQDDLDAFGVEEIHLERE